MLEGVDKKRRDEPAVLSVLHQRLVGGASKQNIAHAPDFVVSSFAREAVDVDLALPVSKAWARSRAHRAALLTVGAVVRAAIEGDSTYFLRQDMVDTRLRMRAYTREQGDDAPEVRDWTWPGAVCVAVSWHRPSANVVWPSVVRVIDPPLAVPVAMSLPLE